MNKVYIFLFLLFVIACNTQTETKITPLPEPKVVVPEVLPHDLIMQPPLEAKSYGDYLFFTQPTRDKSILFYNKKTTQHNFWGNVGGGPDDFMSASCVYQNHEDNTIELYDTNLRKMVSFKTHIDNDSITLIPKERYRIDTDSIFTLGMHKMDNGYYVSQVLIGHKNMFVLFDEELKVYKTFGDKPITEMPDENYSYLYGWFASKGNKLFYAAQSTGYLACYEISDKGNVKKNWEAFFTTPQYETTPFFSWKRENKEGFFDIQVNNEYLFLSFNGKSYGEGEVLPQSILILNHDGKLKKHLKLDEDHLVGKFTLVGDSIYAVGLDQITKFNWRKELN